MKRCVASDYYYNVVMENKIETFIENNPDWYEQDSCLVAGFEFPSFDGVSMLIANLLTIMKEQNHHAEVTFTFNTVEVKSTTHDAGNTITEKDLKLAAEISNCLE